MTQLLIVAKNNWRSYMYYKLIRVTVFFVLTLFVVSISVAEEKISQSEAVELLKGNTAEGKIVQWDTTYKMYLHPSGKLVRLDSRGNVEKGNWRINKKGKFCIEFNAEKCRTLKKRSDGGLNLYNRQGELKLTIDKIVSGNPNNMMP